MLSVECGVVWEGTASLASYLQCLEAIDMRGRGPWRPRGEMGPREGGGLEVGLYGGLEDWRLEDWVAGGVKH